MAENKIPVLTEVYKPNKVSKIEPTADIPKEMSPELVAKIAAQVKPRLETEITDFVLDELKAEINKARNEIIISTKDFIDKTKADLKTELPGMYQESVKLAQVNLSEKFSDLHVEASAKFDSSISEISQAALQSAESDVQSRVANSYQQHMESFEPAALAKSQKLLEAQLEIINQEAQQTLTQQLKAFQEKVIEEHQLQLENSLQAIQKTVHDSAEQSMNETLAAAQDNLMQIHQKQLSESLEGFLQTKGEAAEKELLQKVQDQQQALHADYQQKLSEEMTSAINQIKQLVEESTQEQTDLMFTQVGTIQQETFAKLREDLNVEKIQIFNEAAEEIKTAFNDQMIEQSQVVKAEFLNQLNGDLPHVQAVLQSSIETILSDAVPDLEVRLRDQLTKDIQALLLKVKFVLPE